MKKGQWYEFCKFKNEFESQISKWNNDLIVYNTDLDKINEEADIKLIIIGDNPGDMEWKHKTYLNENGKAGRSARNFFLRNFEKIKICPDNNIIFFNKTPIYTSKTDGLKNIDRAR